MKSASRLAAVLALGLFVSSAVYFKIHQHRLEAKQQRQQMIADFAARAQAINTEAEDCVDKNQSILKASLASTDHYDGAVAATLRTKALAVEARENAACTDASAKKLMELDGLAKAHGLSKEEFSPTATQ